MKKIALLGIDLQNDFTTPEGSLYVKDSVDDVQRISDFIAENGRHIQYIALSMDSHQPIHIANQIYWRNAAGEMPELFSSITSEDLVADRWIPQYNQSKAFYYLVKLEEEGEVCTIWPPHCILGTGGWTIDKKITDSLYDWCIKEDRSYDVFCKGNNQSTEHYSIFKAAVPFEDDPETQLNTCLLDLLDSFDELIIVGEAADFCVVNSLKDIVSFYPELARKTVLFTDCMSWIIENNSYATEMFENAKNAGVKFTTSTEYKIEQ